MLSIKPVLYDTEEGSQKIEFTEITVIIWTQKSWHVKIAQLQGTTHYEAEKSKIE